MVINHPLKTCIVFIGIIFILTSSSEIYAQETTGTITKNNNTYTLTISKNGKQENHQVTRPTILGIPGPAQNTPDNSGSWMEKHANGSATLFSFGANNTISTVELTADVVKQMDMVNNVVNQQMAKNPPRENPYSQANQQYPASITKSNGAYILTFTKNGIEEKHTVTWPMGPEDDPDEVYKLVENYYEYRGTWDEKFTKNGQRFARMYMYGDGKVSIFTEGPDNSPVAKSAPKLVPKPNSDQKYNPFDDPLFPGRQAEKDKIAWIYTTSLYFPDVQIKGANSGSAIYHGYDEHGSYLSMMGKNYVWDGKDVLPIENVPIKLKNNRDEYAKTHPEENLTTDPFLTGLGGKSSDIDWRYVSYNKVTVVQYPLKVNIKESEMTEAFYHGYDKTGSYVTSYKTGKAYKWNGQSLNAVEKVPANLLNSRDELFTKGNLSIENGKPVITFLRNGKKEMHEVGRLPLNEMNLPMAMDNILIQNKYEGSLFGIWIEVVKNKEDEGDDGRIFNVSSDGTIIMTKILSLLLLTAVGQ